MICAPPTYSIHPDDVGEIPNSKMRFLRLAAAALAVAATDARLFRIGIPATIRPGDVFNATVEQLAGIPLQYAMVFGIERYDQEASIFPRPGSLGPVVFHHVDLQGELRVPVLYWDSYANFPGHFGPPDTEIRNGVLCFSADDSCSTQQRSETARSAATPPCPASACPRVTSPAPPRSRPPSCSSPAP